MDLRQLQNFVRVAEAGSLTRAAAALAIAQPMLSRQIRSLENELGAALLVRTGRGVALTEAGERLLVHARNVTRELAAAVQSVGAVTGRPVGTVSVAMVPSAGRLLWMPLLTRLAESYPDIRLHVREGYSGDCVEWLVGGRVDVALLYEPHLASQLKLELLLTERLYLIGAPGTRATVDGRVTLRDLAALPLVLPGRNHAIRRLLEQAAAKHALTLDVRFEVDAYPAITHFVAAGFGYTVLPIAPVLAELHAGQIAVAAIVDPPLAQTIGLVTSTHHQTTAAARVVCDMVRELVDALVRSGRWPADREAETQSTSGPV